MRSKENNKKETFIKLAINLRIKMHEINKVATLELR
jgi:hypothetical protein